VWKGKFPPVEAFEAIAQLITPKPPIWLKEHLHRWLPLSAYAVEALQPSRAEMRANLTKVGEAASLLIKALGSTAIVEFLDLGADRPVAPGDVQATLVDIRDRAAAAYRSSALVDSRGRTKAGRGRALPKAGISPQAYCALLIAEAWLYFRGNYPSPGNKQAAEATDIYWRLLGGELQSWGSDRCALRSCANRFGAGARRQMRQQFPRKPRLATHAIVTYLPIGCIVPDPTNPRKHSAEQIRAIANSIEAFGFNAPILVDKANRVVAGHGRLEAALLLGLAEAPVIRLEHLSEQQAKAYMLADNKLTDRSSWDDRKVAIVLKELSDIALDFEIEATGFEPPEIDLRIHTKGLTV
jgi:ParB-like nuclease domain